MAGNIIYKKIMYNPLAAVTMRGDGIEETDEAREMKEGGILIDTSGVVTLCNTAPLTVDSLGDIPAAPKRNLQNLIAYYYKRN